FKNTGVLAENLVPAMAHALKHHSPNLDPLLTNHPVDRQDLFLNMLHPIDLNSSQNGHDSRYLALVLQLCQHVEYLGATFLAWLPSHVMTHPLNADSFDLYVQYADRELQGRYLRATLLKDMTNIQELSLELFYYLLPAIYARFAKIC